MSSVFHHSIPFHQSDISIVLLAAGGSTRLGQPKQLLKLDKKFLIQQMIEQALFTKCHSVIVVLGSAAPQIIPHIQHYPIHLAVHSDWQKGMGSSISYGIKTLQKVHPQAVGALFMLCDQPFVTDTLLHQIIVASQQATASIVACQYGTSIGVPALFSRTFFEDLETLEADRGAKFLIKKNLANTTFVPFPAGNFDLDTQQDYKSWQALQGSKTRFPKIVI